MAKSKRKKTRKQMEAGQCVDSLIELHRLQGALLGWLKKSVQLKKKTGGLDSRFRGNDNLSWE